MALRHALVRMLPRSWELPLRYWYTLAQARIDIEAKILARYVRPRSTAVDVGAHAGLVTYLLARSGAETVHSFEPLSEWRRVLEAWARERVDVRVHPFACSDQEGEFTLRIPKGPGGRLLHSRASIEVPQMPHVTEVVRTTILDKLAEKGDLRDVSVIKIDVEGHEDAVLRGASGLLARDRPALMIEIEARHRSTPPMDAFALLRQRGYEGYFIEDRTRVCGLVDFDVARHQRSAGTAGYVNNFLFVPVGSPAPTL